MRFLVVLSFLLGACDLKPPPKKQPPATAQPAAPAAQPPAEPPALPPAPPDAGAPAADAGMTVSQGCIDVAAHIAGVLIADAKDPAQKAALEQDRTKIIRRSAEGCTRDGWSEQARTCFLKASSTPAMQLCSKSLRP